MKAILCLLVAVAAGLSGCVHPHGMPPGQAKKVSVHVHAQGCGHVCVGGSWIAASGGPAKRHHGK